MSQHFQFKPSRYLAVLLGIAHGSVLGILPWLSLPFWARLLLAAVLLGSLGYYLWREAGLRAADSCIGLVYATEAVTLQLCNGEQVGGKIAPDSLVTPLLTVLRIVPEAGGGTRSVVLLADSMDREAFRQLRVRLQWGAQDAR
jgi:toxin CptA